MQLPSVPALEGGISTVRRRGLLTTLAGISATALFFAPQLPYGRSIAVMIVLLLLAAGPVVYLLINYAAARRRHLAGTPGGGKAADGTESSDDEP